MKNLKLTFILICILLFAISNLQAQAPEKINYQAVARNLAGNPLVNQAVGLEFNIRQGSPTGAVVYSETHTGISTNQFGLFTAEIGGGTVNSGIFSAINWGLSSFYLQVTIDGNILPATQLLSVPFALYAKESANGPAGASGHNSLMNSTPEPAGTNCTNGGYFIQTWLDLDDDGTLSTGETPISYYVCNGADGAVGPQGPAGTNGTTYFAGNGISLSGDTITNIGDADNNPTNELQTLSLQNDSLFLSNGNYVVLPTSSAGHWSSLNGIDIQNSNSGNVGIGTATIPHQLTVVSTDTVIASFTSSNPYGSVIAVWGFNPNAVVGSVYLTGTDSGIVAMNPTQKTFHMTNTTPGGHTILYADSTAALYGKVVGNIANDLIYNQTNRVYNETDTIYNYSSSGKIINVNQGMFLTDSLYVLGSNATNTNWILANDGFGQAKWTDPSTIVGSVGDNWGSQVVIHDTTLTGTGIAGTPLSVNPNIIPTQTSQLTNNSGFITSPNDGDTSITNELQVLSFNNDTLYLSNGNAVYLPPAAGDSWGSDSVITAGANISGSGTSANPLMILDNDTSATNEIQTLSLVGDTLSISGGNNVNLSTLSGTTYTAGVGINLTGDTITNTAPDQTVVITGGGTTSVTSAYPNFTITTTDNDTSATNEIQSLSNTISPGTVTIGITGGASTTFSIDDADANPSNELITSFGVNGTSDSLVIKEAGNDWAVPLSSLSTTANAWNLTGNALTNTATDFIGTIDNKSLNFRVFNQKAGKIDNGLYVAFFGFQAGNANTTGGNNNAFGTQAMFSNTTGGSNNAFGWAALYSNTGGQANTALGEEALYSTVSSNYNTGVGYEALYFSTGANNTGVGSFAGDNNITGSSNTFLGYNADANWDNLINATAIGANALVMTSNTVQLGAGADIDFDRALMPNGDPGTSGYLLSSQGVGVAPIWVDPSTISTSLWTDSGANTYLTSLTDNVGIGTNNPLSKLHIQGTSDPLEVVLENGGGAFKTGYSVKTGAGQSWFMGKELTPDFVIKDETVGQVRLQIATNGNVGIGTISPESMLHVALPNTANHKAFQLGHGNQPTLEWLFKVDEFSLFSIANENNGIEFTAMVIDANNGNVGVGTTTANSRLDVQNAANNVNTFSSIHTGTNAHAGYFQINNTANNLNAINATTNGAGAAINASNTYNGANAIRDGIYVTTTGAGGAGTVNKAAYFSASGASNNYAAIFDQGNVGIGTGSPSAKLHLEGSLRLNNLSGTAPAIGSVLTSIDAAGNAEWAPPSGAANAWNLNGNTGTIVGTHFIGTSDAQPLMFKVNGNKAGFIDYDGSVANTGLGYQTLYSISTGTYNTAMGYTALRGNTTGNYNTAMGIAALYNNSTGSSNTAIGGSSLNGNLTGSFNTAIGDRSLQAVGNGSHNTAVGYLSLLSNSNAGQNVAIGSKSLYTQSFANGGTPYVTDNVAVGYQALYSNQPTGSGTDALRNIAVGSQVLYSNTTGLENTAIGHSALSSNNTGLRNTANGAWALYNNTTGSYNVALGYLAGVTFTGANANITGNNNTFIGYASGPGTSTQLTNATAIGANAIVNQSNSLVLGNGANVGIGTGTPSAKLHLEGSLRLNNLSGTAPAIGSVLTSIDAAGNAEWAPPAGAATYWSLNGSDIYNNNAGNVGIGTTTPGAKLNIVGNPTENLLVLEGSGSAGGGLKMFYQNNTEGFLFQSNDQGGIQLNALGAHKINFFTSGTEKMRITPGGNVGIGTTNPTNGKLEVVQSAGNAIHGESTSNSGVGVYGKNAVAAGVGVYGWAGGANGTGTYGYGKQYGVWGYGDDAGTGVYAYLPWFANSGRGLFAYAEPTAPTGTTYAVYALNSGTTANSYGIYSEVSSASAYAGYFVGGKNYFQGSVGIGVTPTSKLEVANSTLNNTAKIENTFNTNVQKEAVYGITSGSGTGANIGGKFEATGGSGSNYALQAAAYSNVAGATNYGVHGAATGTATNIGGFFRASGGSANYALIVPSGGGNVGIGTSTPTAGLDVNSTIVISGANTNELNRAQTGAANLVPIAYGSVGSGAAITNAGTGNWSVAAGGAGQYTITVTGETFVGNSHIMSGTMNGSYGFISLIAFSNNILVQTTNTGGTNQNAAFSFIVYKP